MLELFEPDWRGVWKGVESQVEVGAVYTRPEIVELILDVAGYIPESRRLSSARLLEPSCGDGAFLCAVVPRLLKSEQIHCGIIDWHDSILDSAIRAVDLSAKAVARARAAVHAVLVAEGCKEARAIELVQGWIAQGDFLLTQWQHSFNVVVGNPPYVRLEDLPKSVLQEYRRSYSTLRDRADLYIAFFERGLQVLSTDGVLAFISANRFAKNQYGTELRKLIASRYRVRHYINLEHTQPFLSEVSAYPAIIAIDRKNGRETRAATLEDIEPETLCLLRAQVLDEGQASGPLKRFDTWFSGGAPWSTTSSVEASLLELLKSDYPTIEHSGGSTRVGIGVATGADEIFVLPGKSSEIEDSRQIPLLMAGDISPSCNSWAGRYLVNPFADENDGSLVDLHEFPGLSSYLDRHAARLRNRHVARARPANWYRTIDRVWPSLAKTSKLVIPDIQKGGVVGVDSGQLYPHHNVYWVTSDAWEPRALQAVLRSSLVLLQVRAYSVQMRGGSLRYQAQTLRRLHVPRFTDLAPALVDELISVSTSEDQAQIDRAVEAAYGLAR